MRFCFLSIWLAGMAAPLICGAARAESLEKLLMPGKLVEAHAKYEDTCKSCHEPFSKASQRRLCLACHKAVAGDVESQTGFHGRNQSIKGVECKHCHADHLGRAADIVRLDKETFDHRRTDFMRRGAHANVSCEGCHKPKIKYRAAPARCVDCHRTDDRHKGRLGPKCADCHSERIWSEVRYDHDKTGFALKGKHRETGCESCHPGQRYKETPKDCLSCHRLNDVHAGQYGDRCDKCHVAKGWKDVLFDHDKKTKFPLRGQHAKIACRDCHTDNLYEKKIKSECFACHANDDEHKGRNGRKCGSCHTTTRWKPSTFIHERDAKFPLLGKHERVACQACHTGVVTEQKLATDCFACHRGDDPHKAQQGSKCDRCHDEQGWLGRVFFDHDLSRFPLIGLHAAVPCEGCHLSAAYKEAALDCAGCHQADDVHKRRLGNDCAACHNPNSWSRWRFDHAARTDFTLDGAHQGLDCLACHVLPMKRRVKLDAGCVGCHERDDVHRGKFGRTCQRCHGTKSFKEIRVRR